jgi:hypothetical protein
MPCRSLFYLLCYLLLSSLLTTTPPAPLSLFNNKSLPSCPQVAALYRPPAAPLSFRIKDQGWGPPWVIIFLDFSPVVARSTTNTEIGDDTVPTESTALLDTTVDIAN